MWRTTGGRALASGVTRFTAGAVGVCGALVVIEAAQGLGIEVPRELALVAASVSAVFAATVAIRNVAFVWRGPVILPFPRGEAMLCDAREASAVRSAAQLRGTMGGAGYLHPRRLAFSAIAWAAVSMQSVALLPPHRAATTFVPLAVALLAAGLTAGFPASPFYYREAGGGCVLAFPPAVCRRLLDAAGVESALRPIDLGMVARRRSDAAGSAPATAKPEAPAGEDTSRSDPWTRG